MVQQFKTKQDLEKALQRVSLELKKEVLPQIEQIATATLYDPTGDNTSKIARVAKLTNRVMKEFKPNKRVIYALNNELDQAWVKYQKIYYKTTKKKVPAYAKSEFILFYISGNLHLFDPTSRIPLYLTGDININGMKVQVKNIGGAFNVHYSKIEFERWLKRAEKISGVNLQEIGNMKIPIGVYPDLIDINAPDQLKEKLKFIELYEKIDQANWYIFWIENNRLAIAVPKIRLSTFITIFQEYFTFDINKDKPGTYILRYGKNRNIMRQSWQLILHYGAFFAIHAYDDLYFYSKRGTIQGSERGQGYVTPSSGTYSNYSKTDINMYNTNIQRNPSEFFTIHNTFFGGLKYRVNTQKYGR